MERNKLDSDTVWGAQYQLAELFQGSLTPNDVKQSQNRAASKRHRNTLEPDAMKGTRPVLWGGSLGRGLPNRPHIQENFCSNMSFVE
jgi:hypothetical protein